MTSLCSFARRQREIEIIWKRRRAMLAHIRADEWQTIISSAGVKAAEEKSE